MLPLGPLVALALGSLRQHWRVTLALLLGSLLLSGALAAVPITHERLRDAALRDSLATAPPGSLELRVTREGVALDRVAYRDAQAALDQTVANALGDAIAGQTRGGTTAALTLASVLGGEGPRRDLIEDTFGPAALRFRSDLEAHITLLEGSFPEAMPRGVGDPIPVLAASDTARQANLAPGQELVLVPRRSSGLPPIAIVIAGIAEPSDPASPYWGGRPGLLERTASGGFALFVPETTFFGAMPDLLTRASAAFEASYTVNPDAVQTGEVAGIAARVRELPRQLAALGGAEVESTLPQAIEGAADVPGFDLPALALRFGQIAAGAGLLVFGAASALAARREPLRAGMRLSGASRTQIAALELGAALPAALLALVAAAPVAAFAVTALGLLDGFEGLGGVATISPQRDLPWAGAGALAVLVIGLAASGLTGRRAAGRGAWLTAAAVGVGALFWALTRQETLFEAGETRYALLLAPAALLTPVALLAWLLVPRIARPLAWLASIGPGITLIGGLRAVARHSAGVAFPLVLLAAAAAVLLATLPGTLDRSPADRAAHAAGGDLRSLGLDRLTDAGEAERRAAIANSGMDAASPLVREDGALGQEGSTLAVEVLGIDPASFGAVANVRPDLSSDPLPAILSALSANATTLEGHPVPVNSRQIGAWVRLTDTSGEVRIALSLRNERGRYVQLLLGVADAEPGGGRWLFHAADLGTPLDVDGASIAAADLAGRLTLHGFYLLLGEEAAAAPGSTLLGPVLAALEAPAAPRDRIDLLSGVAESFEQRAIVHDLADRAGLEPIDGLAAGGASVVARDTFASAPGFRGAQHLDWSAATEGSGSSMRGLRQATDGAPALIYASRAAVDRLALAPGEEITLTVRDRTLRAQVAGELAGFPTFPADAAFVVAGLDRLLAAVNASPHRDPLATNEAWFAAAAPAQAAAALRGPPLHAASVIDRESARAALGREQAAALGWRTVLAFGFGTLLAVAFAAVLLDIGTRREERERERAAIEAMGGSPAGRLATVAIETLVRLGAAAAIGAAAAVPLAWWLLTILARDTSATLIEPPLRLEVESGPLWLAAFALALGVVVTVAAAGLRYRGRSAWPATAGTAPVGEA